MQRQCVAWFRAQYPQYAMLLTHIPNEGNGNRVSGAIRKAEGTVRGVPDLILFMASEYSGNFGGVKLTSQLHALGVELKTAKGRQSPEQKDYQKMFEAAGYKYVLVRSLEEFQLCVKNHIAGSDSLMRRAVAAAHVQIEKASKKRELAKFNKIIGKEAAE